MSIGTQLHPRKVAVDTSKNVTQRSTEKRYTPETRCEVMLRNTQIHKAMASRQWLAHVEHSDTAAAVGSDARCSGTTRGPLHLPHPGWDNQYQAYTWGPTITTHHSGLENKMIVHQANKLADQWGLGDQTRSPTLAAEHTMCTSSRLHATIKSSLGDCWSVDSLTGCLLLCTVGLT